MLKLEAEITSLKVSLSDAQISSAAWEKKAIDSSALAEMLSKEAQGHLAGIANTFKERVEGVKKRLKTALIREKKRADAYKEKAIEAHNRAKGRGVNSSSGNDDA